MRETYEWQLRSERPVDPEACLQTDIRHKNYRQRMRVCCCSQGYCSIYCPSEVWKKALQSRAASVGVARSARVLFPRILAFGGRFANGESGSKMFA